MKEKVGQKSQAFEHASCFQILGGRLSRIFPLLSHLLQSRILPVGTGDRLPRVPAGCGGSGGALTNVKAVLAAAGAIAD